jgi:hypothetical protein
MYRGVQLAEQLLQGQAAAAHLQLPAYRAALQKRYWRQLEIQNYPMMDSSILPQSQHRIDP